MLRRTFAKILLASAVAVVTGHALAAEETIRIGVSGPKSGPQSGGAAAVFAATLAAEESARTGEVVRLAS